MADLIQEIFALHGTPQLAGGNAPMPLVDPGAVKLEANRTAEVDLKLVVTKDIAKQMEPADWFLSNPEIKDRLIDGVKFGQNFCPVLVLCGQ